MVKIRNEAGLNEVLTPREQNILAHLANDKSSQEIAGLEMLANSSVKWYIHQVYAKLGVNRRRAAILRARELGLLRAEPAPAEIPIKVKNNLPAELTRFFGREDELTQITQRLAEWRMLTLTGAGGVGKTRLAQRVARSILPDYLGGVWFVELASTSDPQRVAQQVAASLGLRQEPGQPDLAIKGEVDPFVLDWLKGFLCSRTTLLVLDNCEHLLQACAHLADSLLQACPQVKILATSREPLGIAGEAIFRVPSLPFPAPSQALTPETVDKYAAVRLFADRARQILPGYQVTRQNAGAVASICQRLDGIPLAIELAAARTSVLTAEELAARLDDVFRLLTGGSRAGVPRQQTLRATIDWSYQLLSDPESRLLRRLSVFAGGWDLAGAEGVCTGEGLETYDILDLLANLVNKSMVIVSPARSGGTRYQMLETLRQYAQEKMLDSGEMAAIQQRHLTYFADLAETTEPQTRGPFMMERQRRLQDELENIHLALSAGLKENPTTGLRLASALWSFWGGAGRAMEGLRWLKTYLDHPQNAGRSALRAQALWRLVSIGGPPPPEVENAAQESLEIFCELRDRLGQGCAQIRWGQVALFREDTTTARVHLFAALAIFEELQEEWWLATAHLSLAWLAHYQGDVAAEFAYFEKALGLHRKLGELLRIAWELNALASCTYLYQGDLRKGYAMLVEAQGIFRQIGTGEDGALDSLVEVLSWQGEFERARQAWEEELVIARQSDDDGMVRMVTLWIGRFTCLQGRLEAGISLMEGVIKSLKESGALYYQLAIQQTFLMELAYAHTCLGEIGQAESLVAEFRPLFGAAIYQPMLLRLLGFIAFQKGEVEESGRCYRQSLQLADQMQWRLDALLALEGYAWALSLAARPVEAARLLGAAAEFRTSIGAPVFPRDQPVHDRVIAALKKRLGEAGYAAVWAEGQASGFDRAIDQAIDG